MMITRHKTTPATDVKLAMKIALFFLLDPAFETNNIEDVGYGNQ